jgi:hypothetical protein
MLTILKPNKGAKKIVKLTPKIAGKMARKVKVKSTTYEDVLRDIELRAQRGYTWTYMLQVELDTITQLKDEGWDVKITNANYADDKHMIRITW